MSVSATTFESTRIVFSRSGVLRKPAIFNRGMPVGGLSSANHSYITLAIVVFLHTMMNTGGRGSSPRSGALFHVGLPKASKHGDRRVGIFQNCLGLGVRPFAATLRRR